MEAFFICLTHFIDEAGKMSIIKHLDVKPQNQGHKLLYISLFHVYRLEQILVTQNPSIKNKNTYEILSAYRTGYKNFGN